MIKEKVTHISIYIRTEKANTKNIYNSNEKSA